MKRVIITGATGMVGSVILNECLANEQISEIISLVRKSSGIVNHKLTEIVVSNFCNYSNLEQYFVNKDIAYFCIGVYTGTVSREKFREITVDYTKVFTDMLKKHSPEAIFCFLSGAGADSKEKSRLMFAKDKGIAENYIIRQNFPKTHIFRPGYIYPVIPRKEPNLMYRISRKLYPVLKLITPNSVITSEHLGKAIFYTGLKGGNKTIYENKEIRKIDTT